MRVVLVGYFARGNLGDDAMRDALVAWLAGAPWGHDVRCAPLPSFQRPNLHALAAMLSDMAWADAVVLAGGSHFHDRYGRRSMRILVSHLGVFRLARAAGKRVAFAGIGVGPFATPMGRRLTGRILRTASPILVRDNASVEAARSTGLRQATVVGFDSAALIRPASPVRAPRRTASIGVSIIPYHTVFAGDRGRDRDMVSTLATALTDPTEGLASPVAVFPFNRQGFISDIEVSHALIGEIEARGGHAELEPERSASELLARFAQLRGLIATRYHALLLGYLAGTPTLAVLYDEKCGALAREIGLPAEAMMEPHELLDDGRLRRAVQELRTNPVAFRAAVPVERVRENARAGLSMFSRLLAEPAS